MLNEYLSLSLSRASAGSSFIAFASATEISITPLRSLTIFYYFVWCERNMLGKDMKETALTVERGAEDYCGPGLDNTRLFMRLTAGAGTRCMSLLSSSPNLTLLT